MKTHLANNNLVQPTNNTIESSDLEAINTAYITELFSGIQGEGHWVGQRQIFLRFTGCDLRCQWCDSPDSLSIRIKETSRLEQTAGQRDFLHLQNPLPVDILSNFIISLEKDLDHHSMSLTGGEPLLQATFIQELLQNLKEKHGFKPKIFLETGGHRPRDLQKVINWIDFLSFDLKLPSSTRERALWQEHQEFIKVASAKTGYAKAVLTAETTDGDIETACKILKENLDCFELVLQPVAMIPNNASYSVPSPDQMLDWHSKTIKILGRGRVQVIPQTHKFIGQL
ncbi:MAG: 7-carboxy-7-deazaguanine synthase QueE [Candidatus Caenarcaniphilales bacterium]|nr:7-carboxy-7-deazaguanine synthase QueE [Candidatus Caenarcaniphilales bacterium]